MLKSTRSFACLGVTASVAVDSYCFATSLVAAYDGITTRSRTSTTSSFRCQKTRKSSLKVTSSASAARCPGRLVASGGSNNTLRLSDSISPAPARRAAPRRRSRAPCDRARERASSRPLRARCRLPARFADVAGAGKAGRRLPARDPAPSQAESRRHPLGADASAARLALRRRPPPFVEGRFPRPAGGRGAQQAKGVRLLAARLVLLGGRGGRGSVLHAAGADGGRLVLGDRRALGGRAGGGAHRGRGRARALSRDPERGPPRALRPPAAAGPRADRDGRPARTAEAPGPGAARGRLGAGASPGGGAPHRGRRSAQARGGTPRR